MNADVMKNPPGWELVEKLAQATGMVSVQAECALDEALVMMSERAIVNHCTVYEIAVGVIDRTIRFCE